MPGLCITAGEGLAPGIRLDWQIQRQTVLPTQQPPGRKSGVDPDGNHMPKPCVFALGGKNLMADNFLRALCRTHSTGGEEAAGVTLALNFRNHNRYKAWVLEQNLALSPDWMPD